MKHFVKLLTTLMVLFFGMVSFAFAEPRVLHLQKGDHNLYLFGTMHLAPPEVYPLPDVLFNTLKQSDALALELDLSDPKTIQKLGELSLLYGIDQRQNVLDLLNEQEKLRVEQILGGNPAVLENVKHFTPMFLSTNLVILLMNEYGFTAPGIDFTLQDFAKSNQIPLIALETAQEQLDAVFNVPHDEALFTLKEMLKPDESGMSPVEQVKLIVKAWKDIEQNEVVDEIFRFFMHTPRIYKQTVVDRNHIMAERIETLNKSKKNLFVAVGFLHIVGETGLIELMQQRGYTIVK